MEEIYFVSSEKFSDDAYVHEIVYLCFEKKYRVAYVSKKAKRGGMFWSVMSAGVTKNGEKKYYESFLQDSIFLEKEIKKFLDDRSWDEKKSEPQKKEYKSIMDSEIPF